MINVAKFKERTYDGYNRFEAITDFGEIEKFYINPIPLAEAEMKKVDESIRDYRVKHGAMPEEDDWNYDKTDSFVCYPFRTCIRLKCGLRFWIGNMKYVIARIAGYVEYGIVSTKHNTEVIGYNPYMKYPKWWLEKDEAYMRLVESCSSDGECMLKDGSSFPVYGKTCDPRILCIYDRIRDSDVESHVFSEKKGMRPKYDLDKPLDYIPTYDEALDYLERNGYASEIYQGEEFDMSGLLEEYNRRGVFLAGYNH